MIKLDLIRSSLAFRVILFILLITLLFEIILYIISTNSTNNFLDEIVREDMYEKSMYIIFVLSGQREIESIDGVNDVKIVDKEKNIASELIDDYLSNHNFKGFIFEKTEY